ncbi:hypothetical protein [Brevibacillus agri]
MNKEQSQIQVQTFIKETQKRSESRQQQISHLREDAVIRLQLLGVKEKEAVGLVQAVLAHRSSIADLNELVQAAYQLSIDKGKEKLEEKEIPKDVEGDLRVIVKVGAKEDLSAYEALKRAGMIRNDFECTG